MTFQAAFHADIAWQWGVIYALDVLYALSIVLRFFSGYQERGVQVSDRRKIALHYLKTSFAPELLSVLPIEVFSFAASEPIWAAAIMRLNRCIRGYRVWTLIGERSVLQIVFFYYRLFGAYLIAIAKFIISLAKLT